MHPETEAFMDRIPQLHRIQLFILMSRDLLNEVERQYRVSYIDRIPLILLACTCICTPSGLQHVFNISCIYLITFAS